MVQELVQWSRTENMHRLLTLWEMRSEFVTVRIDPVPSSCSVQRFGTRS
jgi:hypothetical protein